MDYAVIAFNKQQVLVKPGDKFTTLGIIGNEGDVVTDAKVLAFKDKDLEFGTPYLDKKIDLKVVSHTKTDKVDIFKYKSKSRYRRKTGHRQAQTVLEVVTGLKAKPSKKE